MKTKAEAKLAKIVKNVMVYTPPKGSLKKPLKAPSKAELEKSGNWRYDWAFSGFVAISI